MQWQQFIISIFDRLSQEMERAIDGLDRGVVDQQPSHDTNSIGWLAWHLTRGQDRGISELVGEDQLWIKGKWYAKFNRSADPQDTGFGHTPQNVAAFKSPEAQVLLGYHHAVSKRTQNFIRDLTEADLDRKLDNPRWPTLGARLGAIINDNYQHVGQMEYVRGLLKGMGWWEASAGIQRR